MRGLFAAVGPVLAGFDFPIGLPIAYGRRTGLPGFCAALDVFGWGEWAEFYDVADSPEQIALCRPFYPRTARPAPRHAHLLAALGCDDINMLRRQCDLATPARRAAAPLFWTLGGNQVGKAAIAGWREVLVPAVRLGAQLWPFAGCLRELASRGGPVLAEAYPAEAYGHVGVRFGPAMSKRRQGDRRAATAGLLAWARGAGVIFSDELIAQVESGFGTDRSGEDAFDALIGVLGMIEVVDGRRPECPAERLNDVWEGWILGQLL